MPDITDPVIIRFVTEELRPRSELARKVRIEVADVSVEWFAGLNSLIPNDASVIVDGREAEGIAPVTGAQVHSLVGGLIAARDALNAYEQIIAAFTVRPVDV